MATGGDIPNVHSSIDSSNKTLLKSQDLYKYVLDTTVFPNEPECLRELRLLSDKHELGNMATPPDEMQLLGMLIKLAGARNTIEVGVFTGCSLLATALALPDDGKVVAIDVSREHYELGRRPAAHREGRHRAQGGLPGGPRAGAARRAPRRRGQRGGIRLRLRRRRQAQLREVPRAAAPPGACRRRRRVRQHAVGRHGGAAARRAAVGPRPERLGRHTGPQRQALRRRARRGVPSHRRRRRHRLPPPRVITGQLRRPRTAGTISSGVLQIEGVRCWPSQLCCLIYWNNKCALMI